MNGKPLSTIAEELNNVLTVIAMCTDELDGAPSHAQPLADMRDAIQRGALLTRQLWEHAKSEPQSDPLLGRVSETNPVGAPVVLVIEAEDGTRAALAREIEQRGWRVVAHRSVEDAMPAIEAMRSIDLLVIDSTSTGRRFAAQIVERYPSTGVLYLGGFTDDGPLRRELPRSDVSLLCRPHTTTTIVERIGEALTARRPRT